MISSISWLRRPALTLIPGHHERAGSRNACVVVVAAGIKAQKATLDTTRLIDLRIFFGRPRRPLPGLEGCTKAAQGENAHELYRVAPRRVFLPRYWRHHRKEATPTRGTPSLKQDQMATSSKRGDPNTGHTESRTTVGHMLQAVGAGFTSGLLTSVLLNPYDRALYLALKERRPFLAGENFANPWKGAFQTLFQRAFSSGIYFPLEDLSRQAISKGAPAVRGSAVDALAGQSAGAVTALLLHPLAFVKYQSWGNDERSLWKVTANLMRSSPGGFFIFFRGLSSTLLRDVIFGGVFATGRKWFTVSDPGLKFLSNAVAATAATVLSSPFNYTRAMQFAEGESPTPPSIPQLLARLSGEVRDLGLVHLQSRLQIGWGTFRVTLGMSLSAAIYDALKTRPT